ncbi:hypothetical protein PR048_010648 [Dryococelus australis]|uniref:Uncharacterized protein n=1 Tax=Dryococelus australis TaxID=614101 RepID=A0ABQ9I3A6_9NEOP|nr:hypothetical protein PR048_010648 [Dryococelus australis]
MKMLVLFSNDAEIFTILPELHSSVVLKVLRFSAELILDTIPRYVHPQSLGVVPEQCRGTTMESMLIIRDTSDGMKGREERETPEKTRRPAASSSMISKCENPERPRQESNPIRQGRGEFEQRVRVDHQSHAPTDGSRDCSHVFDSLALKNVRSHFSLIAPASTVRFECAVLKAAELSPSPILKGRKIKLALRKSAPWDAHPVKYERTFVWKTVNSALHWLAAGQYGKTGVVLTSRMALSDNRDNYNTVFLQRYRYRQRPVVTSHAARIPPGRSRLQGGGGGEVPRRVSQARRQALIIPRARPPAPAARTSTTGHMHPDNCVFIGCYPTPGSYGIRKVFPCKSAIGSEACRAGLINCDPIAKIRHHNVSSQCSYILVELQLKEPTHYSSSAGQHDLLCSTTFIIDWSSVTEATAGTQVILVSVFPLTTVLVQANMTYCALQRSLLAVVNVQTKAIELMPVMVEKRHSHLARLWACTHLKTAVTAATIVDRLHMNDTYVRYCTEQGTSVHGQTTRLPPTKANEVRFPAGLLPDFRVWESCRTMPLDLPLLRSSIPALLRTRLNSPSSALNTSVLRAAQILPTLRLLPHFDMVLMFTHLLLNRRRSLVVITENGGRARWRYVQDSVISSWWLAADRQLCLIRVSVATGNSALTAEHFTIVCPNHVQCNRKGSNFTNIQQPIGKRRGLKYIQYCNSNSAGC